MTRDVIGERQFAAADIGAFADAAGDWNPVHVDPVAARRLLTGGVVAHGASTLLWMLDRHLATAGVVPASLDAAFPRPLAPGDTATVDRTASDGGAIRLSLRVDGEELSSALLDARAGVRVDGEPPEATLPRRQPEVHSFSELAGACGALRVHGVSARDRQAYPALHGRLGPRPVAALMAVSRLVGMHCPGLHSLIASMRVEFDPAATGDELEWRVTRHSVPAAPIRIAFRGSGIAGHVDAFVRPAPVAQPALATLREAVGPREFAAQAALVVGGSRGLGEIVAKLVALGGGDVVVTYHAGRDDARRVVDEIVAGGGSARLAAFDAAHARRDYDRIVAASGRRSHVYYFAAPRIGRAKSRLFSAATMRDFAAVFVEAFGQLAAAAAASAGDERIRIFYPSTVFLDDPPREQGEYVAAKAAGEALCAHLARHAPQLAIVTRRLPRLHTDQSAGLLGRQGADPVPVLLALLREIDRPQPTGATA